LVGGVHVCSVFIVLLYMQYRRTHTFIHYKAVYKVSTDMFACKSKNKRHFLGLSLEV
jgi:hypothetical protein